MLDVSKGSWVMYLPAYLVWFFAANGFMFASGIMDSMIPMMMGTGREILPIMIGPVGDFAFLSNSIGNTALGFMFYKHVEVDPKTTFLVFSIFNAVWLPLMYYMYTTTIIGLPGLAQYGTIITLALGISVYTYTKL